MSRPGGGSIRYSRPAHTAGVVGRLVVLLGLAVLTFAVFQEPVRAAETRVATWLLHGLGVDGVTLTGGSTVAVASAQGSFRAIVTPSCSALASLLAIACLASLAPGYPLRRKLLAGAAAVATVVAGNVVRIAASLGIGVAAGRSSLVLFHDSVGNVFSFAYTLGGYILMLWLLLPAEQEQPVLGASQKPGGRAYRPEPLSERGGFRDSGAETGRIPRGSAPRRGAFDAVG